MSINLEATAQESLRRANLRPSDISQVSFDLMCKTFECALRTQPNDYSESFYQLAGKIVCIRIIGRSLAAIFQRAFAPRAFLPTDTDARINPDLTLEIWDEDATGIPYPLEMFEHEGNQLFLGDGQLASSDISGRWVCLEREGNISWLDRKTNQIVGCRANATTLSTFERSKPLVILLTLWLFDQDIHVLHAGMVARNGKGLLMTGNSGIGKSTTSLRCLLAGFDYLGDDHVALVRPKSKSSAFVAHSLFQSARILPDNLKHFPALQAHAIQSVDPQDSKVLLLLAEIFPEQVVDHADISAIALPRFSGSATTSFTRATRATALDYIVHNSLYTTFGVGRTRLDYIVQLLGSAPCFWLDLGHDLAGIPPAIDQLLAQIS